MSHAQRGPLAAFAVLSLVSATAVGSLMAGADASGEAAPDSEIIIQARSHDGPTTSVDVGERDLLGGALPAEVTLPEPQAADRDAGTPADRAPRNRANPGKAGSGKADSGKKTEAVATKESSGGSDFTSPSSDSATDNGSDRGRAEKPPTPQGPSKPGKDDPRAGGVIGGGKQKHPSRVDNSPETPASSAPQDTSGPGTVSGDKAPQHGQLKPKKHAKTKGKSSKPKNVWKPRRSKHHPKHAGKHHHAKGKSAKGKSKRSKKRGGAHHRGRR